MAQADPTTVAFIAQREGFTPSAYPDGNHYSIGYGTYATPQEIASGAPITQTDAQARLATEADKAAAYVDSLNPNLAPNQRTALISAAYNLGSFGTGLTSAIRSGDAPSIATHLAQYVQAENPADAAGVANRRAAEVAYFNGTGTAAVPQAPVATPPIPQLRPAPDVLNDTLRFPGATPSPNLRPGTTAPPTVPSAQLPAPASGSWLSTLTPAARDQLQNLVQNEGAAAWTVPGAVTGANVLVQGLDNPAQSPTQDPTPWFSASAQGTLPSGYVAPSTTPAIGAFGSSGLTPSALATAAGTPFNSTATGAYAGSFVPDFTAPTAQTNATASGVLPDGTQPVFSGFGSLQPPSTTAPTTASAPTPSAPLPAPATSWLPQSLQGGAFVPQGPQQPAPAWQGPLTPGPAPAWQGPIPSTPWQGPTTGGPAPAWQGPVTGGPAPAPVPAPESVLTSGGASPLHTVTENSTVPPGPFGIDALVRAAISGDASALARATAVTTFQAGLVGAANATTQITAYLTALQQNSPGAVRAIQTALQANPSLANSLGGPLGDALKPMLPVAFAALPPGQVPLPNLAPGANPGVGTLVPSSSAPGFSGFPSTPSTPLSNAAGSTPQSAYLWDQSSSSDNTGTPTGWTGAGSTAQPVQQVSGSSGQVNLGVNSGYNAPAAPAYQVPQAPAASVSGFSAPQQYYTPQAPAVPTSSFGSNTNYLLGASGGSLTSPLGWSATGATAAPSGWGVGSGAVAATAAPKAAVAPVPQNRTSVQAQVTAPKATPLPAPAAASSSGSFPDVPSGGTLLGQYDAGAGGATYNTTLYSSGGQVYDSYVDDNGDSHDGSLANAGYQAPDYTVDQYSANTYTGDTYSGSSDSSDSSSASADTGGGGTILCGYFRDKGMLSRRLWAADMRFSRMLPGFVREGYLALARPIVARMSAGDTRLERLMWPITREWAQFAAKRVRATARGSTRGALIHVVLGGLSALVGLSLKVRARTLRSVVLPEVTLD